MSDFQLARVVDHVEQGLDLLITQYIGRTRMENWLAAYLRQVQQLEDAIYDVLIKRMIDIATGAQLAAIGRIVQQPNSLDFADEQYRVVIRARIRANRSLGRSIDVLEVLGMLDGATPAQYDDFHPASNLLEFWAIPDLDIEFLAAFLRDAKAAGCWLGIIVPTDLLSNTFMWTGVHGANDTDSPPDGLPLSNPETDDAALGWGDANDLLTTEGLLSDGVYTPR